MAKHESELRIVEVKGSLPTRQLPKPAPARPQSGRAPTREDALEAVRSMKGAASVLERVSKLGDINSWSEVAFWSPLEQTGAELATPVGIFLWHCDFTFSFELSLANGNPAGTGMAYFAGTEPQYGPGGSVYPPAEPLTGQVWCYLDVPGRLGLGVPVSNFYVFIAQVGTNQDPPNDTATIECGIDATSLGQVTVPTLQEHPGGGPYNCPFVAQLSPGLHRFRIMQVAGDFYFFSLSAWQIPYPVIVTKS